MIFNKTQKESMIKIDGQMSIWDVEIIKKTEPISTIPKKVKQAEILFTEILTTIKPIGNEKSVNPLKLTDMQQEFLQKKNIMKNDNLSRVILYCGGGVGIEIKEASEFKTIYVSKEGKAVFEYYSKSKVLPMDKILYYTEVFLPNELQAKNLKSILNDVNSKVKKVIHRKGDENILIELDNNLISLIPNGWKLEFNLYPIDCKESEILIIKK
ncbi:hypothetical protein [Clostridium estertheticum]|uniref:hypothetical protein n=1 Tax=Clostridium estertheticum TaxID=238834 RepID=UPI001C0C1B06|nr:hypothetical protein [Clostridium estertheticum]MBU3173352.1 hypothetical protein [Clostridium estertheticum]